MRALRTWTNWGVWLFAVGGALWVLKVAVIALNDAAGRNIDAFPVPVLYLGAILLMALGATAVGMAVLRRRPWWVQVIGAAVAVVALFLLYAVLDGVLKAALGDAGPSWLEDELGIAATGAVCLLVGILLARRVAGPRPA